MDRAERLQISLELPSDASAESLYILVDVLEQIFIQLFQRYDDRIVPMMIRRHEQDEGQTLEIDLEDPDLPF